MKAIVEDINSVQRRIKVTVPSEDVNKAFMAYFQKVRGKAKVHGFRQGKVPMNLVKKMYSGSGAYDIVDQLIRDHLLSSIRETGIRAISQPYVESSNIPAENEPYEISAIVDVLPEIKLNDQHKNLVVSYEHHTADDHMLGHRLDHLARQHARVKPVEEGARCVNGNLVKVSFKATVDGVQDPQLSIDEQVIEVGRHQLFLPEIENALVGMAVGETKSVSKLFEGENILEKYRNKTAVFEVRVNSIQKLEIPAIDEEFAKDLNYESVEDLKSKVKAGLASYYERLNQDAVHNALLVRLNEKVGFEVPPSITDQVIDHILSQTEYRNDADRQKALADKQLRADVLPEAKMRAKNTMILHEVIKEEKLTVSDDEIREAIREMSRETDPAKQERDFNRNLKQYSESVREQILFKKALSFLLSHAKVSSVPAPHNHDHHIEHDHHDDHEHHVHGPDCNHDHDHHHHHS